MAYAYPCGRRPEIKYRDVPFLVARPRADALQILCAEGEGALSGSLALDSQRTTADSSRDVGMTDARDRVDAGAHPRQRLRQERLRSVAKLARAHFERAEDPCRLEAGLIAAQW